MATVKLCDICGKQMKETAIEYELIKKYTNLSSGAVKEYKMDICKECIDEIEKMRK